MGSVSDHFLLPADSYDSELVREGNDVCRKLNLPANVRRIVWRDKVLWHTLHSDECFFHGNRALFPARMKGRLDPIEWRPLIASFRMFSYLRRNLPGRGLVILPAVFLTLILAGLISRFLGADLGETIGLLLLVIDGPVFVNGITQGKKTQRLQADLLAARAEGKEKFLSSLRKIRDFGLSDVIKTEKRPLRRHFSGKPSLAERIHNLELFKEHRVSG
jgi:hypothetical protein